MLSFSTALPTLLLSSHRLNVAKITQHTNEIPYRTLAVTSKLF